MKKILMIVGLAVLLLAGLSEAMLPRLGSGAVDKALRDALKTETVEVNMRTFPALLMLSAASERSTSRRKTGCSATCARQS